MNNGQAAIMAMRIETALTDEEYETATRLIGAAVAPSNDAERAKSLILFHAAWVRISKPLNAPAVFTLNGKQHELTAGIALFFGPGNKEIEQTHADHLEYHAARSRMIATHATMREERAKNDAAAARLQKWTALPVQARALHRVPANATPAMIADAIVAEMASTATPPAHWEVK